MNTVSLLDAFTYRYNPKCVDINGSHTGDVNIDCALISEYNSPSDLWDKLLRSLHISNKGCVIFVDVPSVLKLGAPVPYPLHIVQLVKAYAIDVDTIVINSNGSCSIIIQTYRNNITIDNKALSLLDFSLLTSVNLTNRMCESFGLTTTNCVPWLQKGMATDRWEKTDTVDIVFTLADVPSKNSNEELRIALRSIETYGKDVGNIWIVTDNPPEWLTGVNIIRIKDTYTNNKDANLITKILGACDSPDVSERFIYWSDDQVLTAEISMKDIFPIYNNRGIKSFSDTTKKWPLRMKHTLDIVRNAGGDVSVNWDSHVPQPIDKVRFADIMRSIDFVSLPGVCINTAYFGLRGEPKRWSQNDFKRTYEKSPDGAVLFDKLYVGYNDSGYNSGLREALLSKFNKPSKYEKN